MNSQPSIETPYLDFNGIKYKGKEMNDTETDPKSAAEKEVVAYYNCMWSDPTHMGRYGDDLILGAHYSFYEKGVKSQRDAILRMNDFVGRLLNLDAKKSMEILDAGCGVGGTSVYLAMQYPHVRFTGISLAPNEIILATRLQKEKQVTNTHFILGNYLDTHLPDDYFDGIFALESACYSLDKRDFIHEMYRVLKPNGKLVVIDGFLTNDKPFRSFMQQIFLSFLKRRAVPNLISLKTFQSYLVKEGYVDIHIQDLRKNVGNFFVYGVYIVNFLLFFKSRFKQKIQRCTYEPAKDADYIRGATLPEVLLGLSKKSGYYAITAIKC